MKVGVDDKVVGGGEGERMMKVFKFNHKGAASLKLPVSDKWRLAGTTQVKFRSSATSMYLIGLLICIISVAGFLTLRLHRVEGANAALKLEVDALSAKIICLMRQQSIRDFSMDDDGGCAYFFAELKDADALTAPHASASAFSDEGKIKTKRSVEVEVEVIENQNFVNVPNEGEGVKRALKTNGTVSGGGGVGVVERFPRDLGGGNKDASSPPSARTAAGDMTKKKKQGKQTLSDKQTINIAKLKLKLETARKRLKAVKAAAAAAAASTPQPQHPPAYNSNEIRAAYLRVRDPNINIEHRKQVIGPWFLSPSPKEQLGFNTRNWYSNISLDLNATSVLFHETGLYLIYAQVYYKSFGKKDRESPAPLGFKINLSKKTGDFQRPIPIAECVTAHPRVFHATCFTQACWHVETGDKIYLEHFTASTPIIEAEDMGQTYLQIVKLA